MPSTGSRHGMPATDRSRFGSSMLMMVLIRLMVVFTIVVTTTHICSSHPRSVMMIQVYHIFTCIIFIFIKEQERETDRQIERRRSDMKVKDI
jgi:hypothetical protein